MTAVCSGYTAAARDRKGRGVSGWKFAGFFESPMSYGDAISCEMLPPLETRGETGIIQKPVSGSKNSNQITPSRLPCYKLRSFVSITYEFLAQWSGRHEGC